MIISELICSYFGICLAYLWKAPSYLFKYSQIIAFNLEITSFGLEITSFDLKIIAFSYDNYFLFVRASCSSGGISGQLMVHIHILIMIDSSLIALTCEILNSETLIIFCLGSQLGLTNYSIFMYQRISCWFDLQLFYHQCHSCSVLQTIYSLQLSH